MKKNRSYLRFHQTFLIFIKGPKIDCMIILFFLLFTNASIHAQINTDYERNVIVLVVKNGATMYGGVEDFNHQNLATLKNSNGDIVLHSQNTSYGDSLTANSSTPTSNNIDFDKEVKALRKEKTNNYRQKIEHYDDLSKITFSTHHFINLPVSEQFFVSKKNNPGFSILTSNHYNQIAAAPSLSGKSLNKCLCFLEMNIIQGDQIQLLDNAYSSFYSVRPPPLLE